LARWAAKAGWRSPDRQACLEPGPPLVEHVLRRLAEANERDVAAFGNLDPEPCHIDVGGSLERRERLAPGLPCRPLVDVPPLPRRVGPDQELEPLQQPVVADAAGLDRGEVGRERPRLDAAEQRDARGLDVDRAAADPVVGEASVPFQASR
jgi:hypothetical protein